MLLTLYLSCAQHPASTSVMLYKQCDCACALQWSEEDATKRELNDNLTATQQQQRNLVTMLAHMTGIH